MVTCGSNDMAVSLQGVTKRFRSDTGVQVTALQDVDLVVGKNEFAAILGATGCGKTTLLNIIAGLEPVDEGRLKLAEDLQFGCNIAYVFQQYTLFPWRTVKANVGFGLEMRGLRSAQRMEQAEALIGRVGLTEFQDAYPYELSGGMRQRAAIAQALATGPRLLLMDEPFGALDDATRSDLQRLLIDMCRENGVAVVFVTHNIDEALILGDRVLVMKDRPGKISREFRVDLPRPRERMTPEFTHLFMEVRSCLASYV